MRTRKNFLYSWPFAFCTLLTCPGNQWQSGEKSAHTRRDDAARRPRRARLGYTRSAVKVSRTRLGRALGCTADAPLLAGWLLACLAQ